jgi:hypothetical protein
MDHEVMDQWPQQEKESDKPTREPMDPRTQQDHVETIALSGTAPTAEALAKFSVEHEGNDHERQRVTEVGKPMEPRIPQGHEGTIAPMETRAIQKIDSLQVFGRRTPTVQYG